MISKVRDKTFSRVGDKVYKKNREENRGRLSTLHDWIRSGNAWDIASRWQAMSTSLSAPVIVFRNVHKVTVIKTKFLLCSNRVAIQKPNITNAAYSCVGREIIRFRTGASKEQVRALLIRSLNYMFRWRHVLHSEILRHRDRA